MNADYAQGTSIVSAFMNDLGLYDRLDCFKIFEVSRAFGATRGVLEGLYLNL